MKKYVILAAGLLFSLPLQSQDLLEIYKNGSVKLIPDTEFAKANDWDEVFSSYNDMMGKAHVGARKSLIFKPDGSIVVSHAYQDFYSLFDADGNFVKEFGVTKRTGEKASRVNSISDIIGGNTFIASGDKMGNLPCFDFEGNMVKTLKANYSFRQLVVLNDNKVAIVGWAIWKEKFRNFVALIDYNTNEEKIIWDHFTDRNAPNTKPGLFNYKVRFEKAGIISINTMPYTKTTGNNFRPYINKLGDKLIISVPGSGEVMSYDFNGNQLSKDKVSWDPGSIGVEEQKKLHSAYIAKMKERGDLTFSFASKGVTEEESKRLFAKLIKEMEDDLELISQPLNRPYFSTILNDSDGNLLFFEFPEEAGENEFNVWIYNNGGQYVCQSSFKCDDYNLAITPGKMVFKDGYIYALQEKNGVDGIPLRLVRFRLQ